MPEKGTYVLSLVLPVFPGDWGMFWGIGQQSPGFSEKTEAGCLL